MLIEFSTHARTREISVDKAQEWWPRRRAFISIPIDRAGPLFPVGCFRSLTCSENSVPAPPADTLVSRGQSRPRGMWWGWGWQPGPSPAGPQPSRPLILQHAGSPGGRRPDPAPGLAPLLRDRLRDEPFPLELLRTSAGSASRWQGRSSSPCGTARRSAATAPRPPSPVSQVRRGQRRPADSSPFPAGPRLPDLRAAPLRRRAAPPPPADSRHAPRRKERSRQ